MMFHSAGDDIRKVSRCTALKPHRTPVSQTVPDHDVTRLQVVSHPVPIQSMRNFERVRVPAGSGADVSFTVDAADLMMTDEKVGCRRRYIWSVYFSAGKFCSDPRHAPYLCEQRWRQPQHAV
jgi:hypothetical protein